MSKDSHGEENLRIFPSPTTPFNKQTLTIYQGRNNISIHKSKINSKNRFNKANHSIIDHENHP